MSTTKKLKIRLGTHSKICEQFYYCTYKKGGKSKVNISAIYGRNDVKIVSAFATLKNNTFSEFFLPRRRGLIF